MDTSMSTQVIGEIIGTMVLVLLGDGVVAGVSLRKTKAEGAGWIAITLGWGAAVTIGAYAAGYMSFAHLNPAVTIGMAIAGKIGWDMVVPYILGQMIGAIIGAVLVYIHYYPHWKETKDQATILGVFATGPAIRSLGANLISEIIGTFMLVFALLAFGMSKFGDGLNPIAVGILILVIGLSLEGQQVMRSIQREILVRESLMRFCRFQIREAPIGAMPWFLSLDQSSVEF